jgi:hypothetical protein
MNQRMRGLNKIFPVFLAALLFASAADASALQVTNRKTGAHVAVPGTNVYFVPAGELTPASAFGGFESKSRRIEVIAVNIDAPFDDIAAGFTDESFRAKGMELKSRGDLTINGGKAILFKVLHPDAGINWGKWIMLAENGESTLVVNAVFISGDADAASDLEIMLKGVYLDVEERVEQAYIPTSARVSGDVSPVSGDVSTDDAPIVPIRMIISNELEPIPRPLYAPEGLLSDDSAGSAVRSGDVAGETAAVSGDAVSGDGIAETVPEISRDVFDRDAAIRMLSGADKASEEGAPSDDLTPGNVSSGDAGGSGINR